MAEVLKENGRVVDPCRTCDYMRIDEGTREYYCCEVVCKNDLFVSSCARCSFSELCHSLQDDMTCDAVLEYAKEGE